jgi:hypothetical protein
MKILKLRTAPNQVFEEFEALEGTGSTKKKRTSLLEAMLCL